MIPLFIIKIYLKQSFICYHIRGTVLVTWADYSHTLMTVLWGRFGYSLYLHRWGTQRFQKLAMARQAARGWGWHSNTGSRAAARMLSLGQWQGKSFVVVFTFVSFLEFSFVVTNGPFYVDPGTKFNMEISVLSPLFYLCICSFLLGVVICFSFLFAPLLLRAGTVNNLFTYSFQHLGIVPDPLLWGQ